MENLHEWAKPELIWFLAGLILLLLEITTPGLIIFFFGVGAWIVSVICLVTDISLNTQLIIFICSSLLLLGSLRKWVRTVFLGRTASEQITDEITEEFVGEKAIVTAQITPGLIGKVELHGSNWEAESDESIPEGTAVEIVGKNNITLRVKILKGE